MQRSYGNGEREHKAPCREKRGSVFNTLPHPEFGGNHDPNTVRRLGAETLHYAGVCVFPFPLKAGPDGETSLGQVNGMEMPGRSKRCELTQHRGRKQPSKGDQEMDKNERCPPASLSPHLLLTPQRTNLRHFS